jgi:hypothetical protein
MEMMEVVPVEIVPSLPKVWASLRANQHLYGLGKLYDTIGCTLVARCFTDDVIEVLKYLSTSIPLLDTELKRVEPALRCEFS